MAVSTFNIGYMLMELPRSNHPPLFRDTQLTHKTATCSSPEPVHVSTSQAGPLFGPSSLPETDSSGWNRLKMAVIDPRTWAFTVMLTANHSAHGFNNFFSIIVKGSAWAELGTWDK
ncbi:hypothetical protein C8034_v012132 [Colletotrichum sidae]|uniref:Uncharacterized protein n=1 Tax=Colletotrichum sidae TaxID=1347389 RepID=A0A4R8PMN8_9PEZI|nr:hypothetical protein C8034_v012132 [Colletotrichum sidae]